jgi:CRISPR-associated protein Cas2
MALSGEILLIAYDVRHPQRLRRLHRWLKKRAVPVQESLFAGYFTAAQRRELIAGMQTLVHPSRDDVRLYVLPPDCMPDVLGVTLLPEGMHWMPEQAPAISLLHHSALQTGRRYPAQRYQPPAADTIERLLHAFAEDRLRRLLRFLGGR